MSLDELLDQGEPKARPTFAAIEGLIGLGEWLEEPRDNFWSDSASRVADDEGGP